MNERPVLLGASRSQVGILTLPPSGADPGRPALLLLNAGLVHRVGPQRLHVRLARSLAQRGFVTLRFDFSGIGDSLPRADQMPFKESTVAETREAMDELGRSLGVRQFCLVGLSSGALASLDTALADPRVVGAGLLNPHGFGESLEWGEHVERLSMGRIYAQNLLETGSWRKLLTGKTNYRRLGEAVRYKLGGARRAQDTLQDLASQTRTDLERFFALPIRVLLLFSARDRSIENFSEILGSDWQARLGAHVHTTVIADANHTFASPVHLQRAANCIEQWMLANWAGQASAPR